MSSAAAIFESIARAIHGVSGMALQADQGHLLQARMAPLLRREGLPDLSALAQRLAAPGAAALLREAAEATTVNETSFFRDGLPFRLLAERILPELAASRPAGAPLRLWSAACSSGQEAYSLAMLAQGRPLEILGTDLSREMVARARTGLYSAFEVRRGLSAGHLAAHFEREDEGTWRAGARLRSLCRFEVANLLHDLGTFGRFDVVFLRNVLIYFDLPTKRRVLLSVLRQVAPDGCLVLGAAESVLGLDVPLRPLPGFPGAFVPGEGWP
jgi:chemotaxis protein methyltransferase CheR